MEVARGSASGVPNSYVMWGGISGWVRTGELKAVVRDMGPELDWDPQWYENGKVVPPDMGPELDWDPQWYPDYENGKVVPAKKLPILPIAAIGYFLLNR